MKVTCKNVMLMKAMIIGATLLATIFWAEIQMVGEIILKLLSMQIN